MRTKALNFGKNNNNNNNINNKDNNSNDNKYCMYSNLL